jgi:hypothetical protein
MTMLTDTKFIKKSHFTEYLLQKNFMYEGYFKKWVFYPGMLFASQDKWWGDLKNRNRPHEGLDILLYSDYKDRIVSIDQTTRIPAMFDGIIAKVMSDLLGKSVLIEHCRDSENKRRFCTIYAHTNPEQKIDAGIRIKEGDVIATISGAGKQKAAISPHLHISVAWIDDFISYDNLDWNIIGSSKGVNLLDPIGVIGGPYCVVPSG